MKPTIIGWREWCRLPELSHNPMLAKIDSGAWSNTIHAEEIEIIEGFPESIVKFRLEN